MKLIKSSFEILEQPTIYTVKKQIELAGRTCYKSEDKITEDSARNFVDMLIKNKHGAMLEHGTIYLTYPYYTAGVGFFLKNPYSVVNNVGGKYYVTTNYRVLVENDWKDELHYHSELTEWHEKRVSVRFICDRGISHELVRHRTFSFAMESQRYCNYSKGKFDYQLTFIQPSTMTDEDLELPTGLQFTHALKKAEESYMSLIKQGWKPQQARAVLPNATKTEIVVTGFIKDWKHFFELRCSPSAHPDMRALVVPLKEEFLKLNYFK